MPRDFSRIDEPQENLILSSEARLEMSDAFAVAHIDYLDSGLLNEGKRVKLAKPIVLELKDKKTGKVKKVVKKETTKKTILKKHVFQNSIE